MSLSILITAAGGSRRLGQPKQLMEVQGQTLLEKSITTVKSAGLDNVFVVLGSNHHKISSKIKKLEVEYVINQNWAEGIGTSIASGVKRILEVDPETSEILIMLCDQPMLTENVITTILYQGFQSTKNIIACKYDNENFGPPVLFKKPYFDQLKSLNQDIGAKPLIKSNLKDVEFVSFPKGSIDLDTMEDYRNFLKYSSHDK